MSRLFISYSHADQPFVSKLVGDLSTEHDVTVDFKDIVPGVPLMEQISAYIAICECFVPIISADSSKSPWVRVEMARGFGRSLAQGCQILPIVLGDTTVIGWFADLPYVRFRDLHDKASYTRALDEFLRLARRSPIVAGKIVLRLFESWGGIDVVPEEPFAIRVNRRVPCTGAGGLTYHGPLHVTGFSKLHLTISGSAACDFTGWSKPLPKMMKVELDGVAIPALDAVLRVSDDVGYIKPLDGVVEYELPSLVVERGFIGKTEIVLGNGSILDLVLGAALS